MSAPTTCPDYEPGHECEQCEAYFAARAAEFKAAYGHLVRAQVDNERWERWEFGRVLTDDERMRDAGRIR